MCMSGCRINYCFPNGLYIYLMVTIHSIQLTCCSEKVAVTIFAIPLTSARAHTTLDTRARSRAQPHRHINTHTVIRTHARTYMHGYARTYVIIADCGFACHTHIHRFYLFRCLQKLKDEFRRDLERKYSIRLR